jgi:hypothetical protein
MNRLSLDHVYPVPERICERHSIPVTLWKIIFYRCTGVNLPTQHRGRTSFHSNWSIPCSPIHMMGYALELGHVLDLLETLSREWNGVI